MRLWLCSRDLAGRRVLNAYLTLFLHETSFSTSSAAGEAPAPYDLRVTQEKLLNTYMLGENVGGHWALERVMRWTPALVSCLMCCSPWWGCSTVSLARNHGHGAGTKRRPSPTRIGSLQSPRCDSRGSDGWYIPSVCESNIAPSS